MRMLACCAAGVLIAVGGMNVPSGSGSVTRDTAVAIKTFQFRPGSLVVPAGTRVIWTNGDEIEHTITAGVPDSANGDFHGPVKTAGASFAHTFTQPGSFSYFCERHPFMRGTIRVTPTGEN